MQSPLQDILVNITMGLPIYIALTVGFFLAIVRWSDTPTASMILIILTPAWLFLKIGFVLLYAFVPQFIQGAQIDFDNIRNIYRGLNCGSSLVEGLAIGLLIWAVFAPRPVDRKAQPSQM